MSVQSCVAPELVAPELCPHCSAPAVRVCRLVVCGDLGCGWTRPRFQARGLVEVEHEEAKPTTKREDVLAALAERPWSTAVELAAAAGCSERAVRKLLDEMPEIERRKLGPSTRGPGAAPYRYALPGTPEPGQDCDGQLCTLVEVEVEVGEEPEGDVEVAVLRVNVIEGEEPELLDGLVEVLVRVGADPDDGGWKTTKKRSKARPPARPHLVVVRQPVDDGGWKTTKKRPHLVVPRRAGGAR